VDIADSREKEKQLYLTFFLW